MSKLLKDSYLDDIVHMYYDLKLSTVDIAKRYECSHQIVGKFLKDNGYVLRTRKQSLQTDTAKQKISKTSSDRWNDDDYKNNQISKRKGRPSGALGKRWKSSRTDYNVKGENNPMWQGGKTKLSFAIKNLSEYKDWRNKVFERDDYTCQCCGRKSMQGDKVFLECHHIKPFSIILSDNNITSINDALKCNELFDINNGQTLCKECHKKTDSYGVNLKRVI